MSANGSWPVAPVGGRVLARIVDGLIVGMPAGVLLAAVWVAAGADEEASSSAALRVVGALFIVMAVMYELVFIAQRGATPGRRFVGVRVVGARDGDVPGWRSSVIRWVATGYPVGTLLGWLPGVPEVVRNALPWAVAAALLVSITLDAERRGWHDKAAGTLVIDVRPNRPTQG